MSESKLCNDHARGNTLRYTGTVRPRTDCPLCWAIFDGTPIGKAVQKNSQKIFRTLDMEGKQAILLGLDEEFRVCMFDLECTSLKPNVGRILCCSFKPIDGEVYNFSALMPRFKRADVYDDSRLAIAIRDELEKFDIIVGWNSKQFDTKFLNSRLLRVGEMTKAAQYHVDGMWTWRSKASAWSGLAAVQQFVNPGGEAKTVIEWEKWMRALGWDKGLREEAMKEIVSHCDRDVEVLETVYKLIVKANVVRSLRRDGGIL